MAVVLVASISRTKTRRTTIKKFTSKHFWFEIDFCWWHWSIGIISYSDFGVGEIGLYLYLGPFWLSFGFIWK